MSILDILFELIVLMPDFNVNEIFAYRWRLFQRMNKEFFKSSFEKLEDMLCHKIFPHI